MSGITRFLRRHFTKPVEKSELADGGFPILRYLFFIAPIKHRSKNAPLGAELPAPRGFFPVLAVFTPRPHASDRIVNVQRH